MTAVADPSQDELALVNLGPADVLPHLVECTSMAEVLRLQFRLAGIRKEKTIAHELGRDPGHMSRVFGGDAYFPHEDLLRAANLTGNDAPALWLLTKRGWDCSTLRRRETELEHQLRMREDRIAQLEMANRVLTRALRGEGV